MKKRVLLIEDDAMYASILQRELMGAGFLVSRARHAEEGVEMAVDDLPNLILLDLTLPRKDGFQALDELKAEAQVKDIPVVMLTSLSAKEDIERCFNAGACEYMIKTQHTPDEVTRRIKKILHMSA